MPAIMEKSPAQRLLALVAACLLVLGCAFALAGCSNDEEVIRQGITQELDAFKNPTKENLSPYIGELDDSQMQALQEYGVDIYEFLGHAFRGFDYTVNDVKVDGNTASADLTVTNVDIANAVNGVVAKVQTDATMQAEVQKLAEGGNQAEIMQYVFGKIYEAMDAADETVTNNVAITLTKSGNEWTIDESSLSNLISNMYGGLAL